MSWKLSLLAPFPRQNKEIFRDEFQKNKLQKNPASKNSGNSCIFELPYLKNGGGGGGLQEAVEGEDWEEDRNEEEGHEEGGWRYCLSINV